MPSERFRTVMGWRRDWTGAHNRDVLNRRYEYLRDRPSGEVAYIRQLVRWARDARLLLARELAWPIYDELHMVDDTFCCSDPFGLLGFVDVPGDDPLLVQRRFEALCLADLGVAMFELELADSMDRVEADLASMLALINGKIMSRDTVDLVIYTYHDPNDMYSARGVSFGEPGSFPGLYERRHMSRCRISRDGIIFRSKTRPKDPFRSLVKIMRQMDAPTSGKDSFLIKDRCAFQFVTKDATSAAALAAQIRHCLEVAGAHVFDDGDNLTADTGHQANVENGMSSRKYRKKQMVALWHGRWYEFQFLTFQDYYGSRYALDDANHVIYKLRQGLTGVLPVFFPGPIYLEEGTWDSDGLKTMLYERQIENLGWHLRRNGCQH